MDSPVKIDPEKVLAKLKRLNKGLGSTSILMGEIGEFLVGSILQRTSEGIDAEGNAFDPYSDSYAEVRRAVGLPTDKVDLFFTGQMLAGLTYETARDQIKLFFANTSRREREGEQKVSNSELAYYNDKLRPFFAISAEEEKIIIKMVRDHINDLIGGR